MFYLKNAEHKTPFHQEDEELLAAYLRTKNSHYFDLLFERYALALYKFCQTYLGHEEDSRDTVMRVFSKSLELDSCVSVRHFKNWLFFLARNECIDQLRERDRRQEGQIVYTQSQRRTVSIFARQEAGDLSELQLGRALSSLRKKQRLCLELFYFENKSYQEIARQTNYSLKEIKSHLQNGKRKLKKLMLKKRSPSSGSNTDY